MDAGSVLLFSSILSSLCFENWVLKQLFTGSHRGVQEEATGSSSWQPSFPAASPCQPRWAELSWVEAGVGSSWELLHQPLTALIKNPNCCQCREAVLGFQGSFQVRFGGCRQEPGLERPPLLGAELPLVLLSSPVL